MWSSIVPQLRILALFPSVPFPHDTVMTCDDCDDIVVTPKYTAFWRCDGVAMALRWRCDGVAMAVLEAVHLRTVTAPAREAISRPALAAQPISWWRLCRTTWSSRNDVFSFRFVSFRFMFRMMPYGDLDYVRAFQADSFW